MAMAFCMMESSSWCRYSKRRKRKRRLLQKHSGSMEAGYEVQGLWHYKHQKPSGGMEAGYGSRARHWNGIKSRVTGGWTSRDYNIPLTSSSDSSSSEEDGASPAERLDYQRMLSPRLGYFCRLFL
ncbi:unnamed protein product [Sphagnum troendelagicum]|uniref:Uncharacterized protein n=1 Tax=Sphagnum troendelagicum TaxID=128251 RepID=A0ABP0UBP8_9BRYO